MRKNNRHTVNNIFEKKLPFVPVRKARTELHVRSQKLNETVKKYYFKFSICASNQKHIEKIETDVKNAECNFFCFKTTQQIQSAEHSYECVNVQYYINTVLIL